MENRNLVLSLALTVSVIVPGIANNVNRSTGRPGLHGPKLQADGIPLPAPPRPKPTGTLMADGIPLPPPPKPKPTGKFALPFAGGTCLRGTCDLGPPRSV
jgi:hypothetical protein